MWTMRVRHRRYGYARACAGMSRARNSFRSASLCKSSFFLFFMILLLLYTALAFYKLCKCDINSEVIKS